MDIHITSLKDLADGVYLILLIGAVGHFFVPMNFFKIKPHLDSERETNWRLILKLLDESEIDTAKLKLDDLLSADIKSISRALFLLQQQAPQFAET